MLTLVPICLSIVTVTLSVVAFIFNERKNVRELRQKELEFERKHLEAERKHEEFEQQLSKDRLQYTLETLRQAFLMIENDIDSRVDAWNEYRSLGGSNYINYYDKYLEPLLNEGVKKEQ